MGYMTTASSILTYVPRSAKASRSLLKVLSNVSTPANFFSSFEKLVHMQVIFPI